MNYNILLVNGLDGDITTLVIIWWIFACIFGGREVGSAIDKENRNPKGKPVFVHIFDKWRWLFKMTNKTYAGKKLILRTSLILQILGYVFAFVELLLLFINLFANKRQIVIISTQCYIIYILISLGIGMVSSYTYEKNMQRAFHYDWITYFQEAFSGYSKRSCNIVGKRNENIYEIEIGMFSPKRYLAVSEYDVRVGDKKIAIHVYDENHPCWEIRNH